MKFKVWFAVALLVVSAAGIMSAQEPKKPEMTAEQRAAMEGMMKAMMPGDAHKLLSSMVGTWDTKVSTWMAPGAPPAVNSATAEAKWVLGNRYVEERFDGSFMGMPFAGISYSGYDNIRKQYWSSWIDNMSTGLMTMTGSTSDQGKNWKYTGSTADAATGKEMSLETHLTVPDNDHHTMEMWTPAPDGKMFKVMEISYTRKK